MSHASSTPLRHARFGTLSPAQAESNRQLRALLSRIPAIRCAEREGRWREAAHATAHVRREAARLGLTDEVKQLLPGIDGPRLRSASASLRRWW